MSLQERLQNNRTIETERLVLRPFKEEDQWDVFEYAGNPHVTEKLTFPTHSTVIDSLKVIQTFYANLGVFAIICKEEDKCIGTIEIRIDENNEKAEVGYVLNYSYWNKGYMSEALQAIIDYCFNILDLHRVEACHYVDNPASGRVMIKCDMVFEGIHRQARKVKGSFHDLAYYSILKEEYNKAL